MRIIRIGVRNIILKLRRLPVLCRKTGSVCSKPCSKVVLLQQTLHLGYKTFGCACAQTDNERNMLKQQINLLPTLFNWTAIVKLSSSYVIQCVG